jgi:lipoyl(octanoyl) transferase
LIKRQKIQFHISYQPAQVDGTADKATIETMTVSAPLHSATPRLDSTALVLTGSSNAPVEWLITEGLTPYPDAVQFMEQRVAAIIAGQARELVWLVEHPSIYTAGTSTNPDDMKHPQFPVFETGRGGQYTYHGPGQRIAYVMLDLRQRGPDLRAFIASLEAWIMATLGQFNISGERREDRVGVWVKRPDKGIDFEDKIAAIGIRVRQWVTFHGLSINVEPDLGHFGGIVPCGVADPRYGVTSLVDLGLPVMTSDLDLALRSTFTPIFGPLTSENP